MERIDLMELVPEEWTPMPHEPGLEYCYKPSEWVHAVDGSHVSSGFLMVRKLCCMSHSRQEYNGLYRVASPGAFWRTYDLMADFAKEWCICRSKNFS